MIRHGEAMHNLKDVYKMLLNTYKNIHHIPKDIITPGNNEMLKKVNSSNEKINALLTTQGFKQARALYRCILFENYITPDNRSRTIYISSPMDRTIQTLIYSTSAVEKGEKLFSGLKHKFTEMYSLRFPITKNEISDTKIGKVNDNYCEALNETYNRELRIPMVDPNYRFMSPSVQQSVVSSEESYIRTGGIKHKSRRNMKRKSKRNKRSKKARKTRKHKKQSRKTKKGYSRK
jgi:site-specific DNA-cytosine methylase